MPRPRREEGPGAVGHVYARGNRGEAIFADRVDLEAYLALVGGVVERYGWCCLAYCLMTNHVHLIVRTPAANLAAGMHWLQTGHARTFNKRHRGGGRVFQGRYGVTPIATDEHLRYAAAYVALNPVKAGLCTSPEEWAWSSHAAVAGRRQSAEWLDVHGLLASYEVLGGSPRRRYVDIVEAAQSTAR